MKVKLKLALFFLPLIVFSNETVVLKMPQGEFEKWKEVCRVIDYEESCIEWIPLTESLENWTQLFSISSYDLPDRKVTMQEMANAIVCQIFKAYPNKQITWKVHDKKDSELIYEWILHEAHKEIPPQHVICHMFKNKQKAMTALINFQHKEMTAEEREMWLKLIRECTIFSLKEASNIENSFSLAEKVDSKIIKYSNNSLPFTINLPASFIYKKGLYLGEQRSKNAPPFTVCAAFNSSLFSGFIYFSYFEIPEDQFEKQWTSSLKEVSKLEDYEILSHGDFTNQNGNKGKFLITKQSGHILYRVFFLDNKICYKIEFIIEEAKFEENQTLMETIARSFSF